MAREKHLRVRDGGQHVSLLALPSNVDSHARFLLPVQRWLSAAGGAGRLRRRAIRRRTRLRWRRPRAAKRRAGRSTVSSSAWVLIVPRSDAGYSLLLLPSHEIT